MKSGMAWRIRCGLVTNSNPVVIPGAYCRRSETGGQGCHAETLRQRWSLRSRQSVGASRVSEWELRPDSPSERSLVATLLGMTLVGDLEVEGVDGRAEDRISLLE